MRVLIDTNIYLNFYRLSDQSLVSLDSLIKIIKEKKAQLILPKQIQDEFFRDKMYVSKEYTKKLESLSIEDISIPTFLQSYRRVRDLKEVLRKIQTIRKEVLAEYNKRILNPQSKINQKLKQLFVLAEKTDETEEVIQKAYYRTLRRNPPRKDNNSFGDAIIWETILARYTDDDLIVISGDGDFASEVNNKKVNEFLEKEFTNKYAKTIKLFTIFGEFINDFTKKQVATKKIIKEERQLNISESTFNSLVLKNVPNEGLSVSGALSSTSGQVVLGANSLGASAFMSPFVVGNLAYHIANGKCKKCMKPYYYDPVSLFRDEGLCEDCRKISFGARYNILQ
jgi:hypothetical protein